MTHLDSVVEYDTLVARGMLDLYGEERVQRWFGERSEISIGEALDTPAPLGIVFWAVLREYMVGPSVLHQIAVDVAAEFVRRHMAQGVYVDFRTPRGLSAKQDWLDGQISDGELMVAVHTAQSAAHDVTGHEDPQVWAVAHIVCQALLENPDDAVTQTYYSFLDAYGRRDDHAALLTMVKRRLGE